MSLPPLYGVIIVRIRYPGVEKQFIPQSGAMSYPDLQFLLEILLMIAQPLRQQSANALAALVLLALAGCSTAWQGRVAAGPENTEVVAAKSAGHKAANVALRQVGIPYRYGGKTPSGFDCSGLVQYSYSKAGKYVPRTTGQLWSALQPVPAAKMKPGDVLFFRIGGKMSHVGLYLGDSRFVHAPSSGRTVSVASLETPFYGGSLIRAGRPR
jgi:cell wall-associated NlpC family hydrolase